MLFHKGNKGGKTVTEDELILSLCKEKDVGIEGSNEELMQKFREL